MKTSLSALHHQAIDWQRELAFYTEELSILTNRLKTTLAKGHDAGITKQFGDFEKEFESLAADIEGLKKDVAVREGVIENMTEETMGGNDTINTTEDVILKQMKDLAHEIADVRFFFNLFLAKL